MVQKSVEIHERHEEWLEDQESFNLSGAVREMLDEEMDRT